MSEQITRRETFRRGLAATSVLALVPDWAMPALAQDEVDVPFTDIPKAFNPGANPNAPTRVLDIRKIDGPFTSKDQFYALQHMNRPEIDPATYKLKLSGLVNKPIELSLDDLKGMHATEVAAGYECSGNSPRSVEGLCSCGMFKGVKLSDVLKHVGVNNKVREVVFFGADRGPQDVVFRQQTFKVDQQFGRSITLENAMKPQPLLAYSLNGDPLTLAQGKPLRLIMPGWYGVSNVKWLAEIHLQEDRYLGNYQARWYRSVVGEGGNGEDTDPGTQWVETEITRQHLKSVIARVRKKGGSYDVFGFVLNDGTPLKSVEVKVDDGPWQKATLASTNTQYSWKLFNYRWDGATPGEHTLVSRVTDAEGRVQPTLDELKRKKTFLEDNSQFPRKVMIG
ncbi:MAG TPA: molybdopterin-dependent oxidoreductase [Bryobacteraceae bacterium]|jgi:DMSO/TMAO reductase YedYZ molybdopterin-dependent catalytic subunit|nr:molybdopterin-dependent oxidoreductase [Bryobacteraceae bacterium]